MSCGVIGNTLDFGSSIGGSSPSSSDYVPLVEW